MTLGSNGAAFTAASTVMPFAKRENQMLDNPEIQAFEARKLDIEIAAKMGARFMNGHFRFEYWGREELQYAKIRREADRRWHIAPSGQPLQLWNLDSLREFPYRPKEPLVLTEGEFDAIAVAQACRGIFVASVPNGSCGKRSEGEILVKEDGRFAYIWGADQKLIPEIDQFDKIILATDNDEPGLVLRDELALRIGEGRCWFVIYPPGCKDSSDVLLKHNEETLRKVIADAKPMRPGYLVKPSDVPPRRMEVTYSTGWGFLDEHIKLIRPELVIVTGEPGHGKGQFIRALTFHLAEAHNWRTSFLTPEDPAHRLQRDMCRFALRNVQNRNREAIERANQWCDDHFRISQPPDDDALTLDIVEHEMEAAAVHHDAQCFVLDPWNEVFHDYGRLSETQYIERSLTRLRRKAKRYGLVLIIAAHPVKMSEDKEPTLWSISGSANWRNKADHGIIVHRKSRKSNSIKLKIEKCKDEETMGVPGEKWLLFDRDRCDYDEVPEPKS
jgi:twinkle protein